MRSDSSNLNNNPRNNNNFCLSAFTSNNPSQKSLLDNSWYFAITPFPSNQYGLKISDKVYKDLNYENEVDHNLLLDVYYPFDDQKFDKIPIPKFSAHTFILILEFSQKTKLFNQILFNVLKEYFSQSRPIFFTILIMYQNSIVFPLINKKRTIVSISTWSDFSSLFELQQEGVYFNMNLNTEIDLFNKYLESISNLDLDFASNIITIDIFKILSSLYPFFKSLRNPIWLTCSDLYIRNDYPTNGEIDKLSQLFFQSNLNLDFYFLKTNSNPTARNNIENNPALQIFTTRCNCSIVYFGSSEFESTSFDIIYNISKPRTVFTRLDVFTTNSLEVDKIYGRGSQINSELYKSGVLTVRDTIHVFIKTDTKKLQNEHPKVVFRVRYVDAAVNCFMRYIPFDCGNRFTSPEALLTAAAIKIANENYDVNDAINELLQLEINGSGYHLGAALFKKRFVFAARSLGLMKNCLWIYNFVIGNPPNDVFEFFSPICSRISWTKPPDDDKGELSAVLGEWKIVPEESFGESAVVVWGTDHKFVAVGPESSLEKLSYFHLSKLISPFDEKAKFEFVSLNDFFNSQQLARVDYLSKYYSSLYPSF